MISQFSITPNVIWLTGFQIVYLIYHYILSFPQSVLSQHEFSNVHYITRFSLVDTSQDY